MERFRARADNDKVHRLAPILLVVVAIALALAGAVAGSLAAGGEDRTAAAAARPLGDPGVFVKQLVVQMARDDYARAWETLHPAHKRVASRWEYVDCELGAPIPGRLVSVKVIRVFDSPILVPGLERVLESKAVTFALTIKVPGVRQATRVTHTGHVLKVNGRWRWVLPPDRFELYQLNLCLGEGPTA